MKVRLFISLALLALASLACQTVLGSTPTPEAANPPAADVGAQPAGDEPSGGTMQLVFQDDFSDKNSGWDDVDWENGVTQYADGRYFMYVKTDQFDIWANPQLYFDGDVRIEVDFSKSSGPDENDIGIICRYAETEDAFSFYYGVVGSDGFAGVYKVVDGKSDILKEVAAGTVRSLLPGDAVNHLRFDCIGSQLTLFANGQQVISVVDHDLTAGDVGLIAGTYAQPNLKVYFDNFKVYTP